MRSSNPRAALPHPGQQPVQRRIHNTEFVEMRDGVGEIDRIRPALAATGGDHVDRLVLAEPSGILPRSEEHTSELQSLMRISYAVFCLKKKNNTHYQQQAQ